MLVDSWDRESQKASTLTMLGWFRVLFVPSNKVGMVYTGIVSPILKSGAAIGVAVGTAGAY